MILYLVKYSKSLHTWASAGTWQVIYVLKFSHHPDDVDGVCLRKVRFYNSPDTAVCPRRLYWDMSYLHKVDFKTAITCFLFTHCWVKEQEPQNLAMSASHFHSWRNIGGFSWQQHITITILHITWARPMTGGECFLIWIFLIIKVLSKNYCGSAKWTLMNNEQIFWKYRSHLKILGANQSVCHLSHTSHFQIPYNDSLITAKFIHPDDCNYVCHNTGKYSFLYAAQHITPNQHSQHQSWCPIIRIS